MKKYKLDNQAIKLLNVILFILTICIMFFVKYVQYTKIGEIRYIPIIANAVILALCITYAIIAFIILPLWFRSVCYTVTQDEIIIKSGVLLRRTVYVKISAVQYLTAVKGPLSGHINLNFLLINAYGGRLYLMFLSSKDMEEIYKRINSYLKDRGGL